MTTRKDDPRLNAFAYTPPTVADLARTEQGGGGETVNQADADAARARMVDPSRPYTAPLVTYGSTAGSVTYHAAAPPPPAAPAADTPPVPEPTSYELKTRMVL